MAAMKEARNKAATNANRVARNEATEGFYGITVSII